MRLRISVFLTSIVIIRSFVPLVAQEQPSRSNRPTVGLVLQGGGTLGLAHVGVITWLEEHHIPIDYVAGTSMGGLVGGVYATGHNAVQIRQVVNRIDWDQVIAGQTPFADLAYRRKRTPAIIPTAWNSACAKDCNFPRDSTPASRSC